MPINVKPFKFTKRNKRLLQMPILEENISNKILQIRQKFQSVIVIGCSISQFSIVASYYNVMYFTDKQNSTHKFFNTDLENLIEFAITTIFTLLIGFIVDLISLRSAFIFSLSISILSMLVNIYSTFNRNFSQLILGQILCSIGYMTSYICFNYILYDSFYNLKTRFNTAALFHIFGIYLPLMLSYFQSRFDIYFKITIELTIIICLLLSIAGLLCLQMSYGMIEVQRYNSAAYKQYLNYQGIGITFKTIKNYYNNKTLLFLFIVSFTFAFTTNRTNPTILNKILQEIQKEEYYETIFNISYFVGIMIPGILIIFYLNSHIFILQTAIKTTKIFLVLAFLLSILTCLTIIFLDKIPFVATFTIYVVVQLFSGALHLFSHVVYNEILSCLHDDRSSLKCIGFALIRVVQDTTFIFFYFSFSPIIIYSLQLLLLAFTMVYSFFYLHNKSFYKIESKIKNQLGVERAKSQSIQ